MKKFSSNRQVAVWCAVLAACAHVLVGCSSETAPIAPEPESKEIPIGDSAAVDTPEEQLFADAKRYYGTELYTVAKDSFRSLATTYALGAYAEFGEIKAADSNYELREYEAAAQLYEEIIKNRPASRALPYLLLRAGRCHELAHRGVGRDQGKLEKALEQYDQLLKRFPRSVYAAAAERYRRGVVERIAEAEALVRDYYRRRDNEKAALAREAVIEKKWAPLLATTEQPEVLPAEVQTSASHEAVPVVVAPAPVSMGLAVSGGAAPEADGRLRVTSATCQSIGARTVFLALSRDPTPAERAALVSPKMVDPGYVFEGIVGSGTAMDCFGSRDLVVMADGRVTLNGAAVLKVLLVDRPSRLALIVK